MFLSFYFCAITWEASQPDFKMCILFSTEKSNLIFPGSLLDVLTKSSDSIECNKLNFRASEFLSKILILCKRRFLCIWNGANNVYPVGLLRTFIRVRAFNTQLADEG